LNPFGIEGHLAMIVGNRAAYDAHLQPTVAERALWNQIQTALRTEAGQALTVAETLAIIRSPQWRWND